VLPRVENVVAWRSLLHRQLRLHSLAIEAPRLTVRRDASGAFHVAGLKLGGGEPGDGRGTDWVLAQDEIVIRGAEIEWRDELRGAPPLTLSALTLRLRNSGNEHAIGITARPPPELAASLELRAVLGGRTVNDLAAWNGRLYAETGYTDLAAWRPGMGACMPKPVIPTSPHGGRGSITPSISGRDKARCASGRR
jgi:uncharacterized protein YhdP